MCGNSLGRQVAGRNYPPTNKNTLIHALTEEWDKLPQQLLNNVVQNMLWWKERIRQEGDWLFPAKSFVLLRVSLMQAVNRDLFLEKLNALIAGKGEDNCFYFSKEKYSKILSEVVSAKTKCNIPLDYRRLKRFDVLRIKDEEKLIVPLKRGKTNLQYYITNDELFSVLYETHIRTGHGGRARMLKELQIKYKNIASEAVMLYLNLCKQCQMKHSAHKKGIFVEPIISSELNFRCQVDLIDLQSNREGEYKFKMVYQDNFTKFVQLRTLKTKRAEEAAYHVFSIFLTFGTRVILQSDNGTEFNNQVISEICAMWKDVKIVYGKPRHSQTQGSDERANQDIKNRLTAWKNDNDTNK
ncbi:KRAB-A domain-containing protein 2 [Trichonephila clavipes]|nr:KRAB-A domain-containing protein 2 [Trichonephila clavipes]